MGKAILFGLVMVGMYLFLGTLPGEKITIPEEAIRLRVLANSNDTYDQEIKQKVSEVLRQEMYLMLKDTKGITEARNSINKGLPILTKSVKNTLQKEDYSMPFTVDFSYHYFPEKEFQNVIYEEGYYESVLITIGSGKGNNWWCVLFPPLCLMEAEETDEGVEYKFFVEEMLKKYL